MTSRQITAYAKLKDISRAEAKEIITVNAMAEKVTYVLAQHSMDRLSLEEYKQVLPDMMKQAYENGEMNQPIIGSGLHSPDTPIMNQLSIMAMRVGKNASKERAEAAWVFMSAMNDVCLSETSYTVKEKKANKDSLRDIFKSVTDRKVAS